MFVDARAGIEVIPYSGGSAEFKVVHMLNGERSRPMVQLSYRVAGKLDACFTIDARELLNVAQAMAAFVASCEASAEV